MTEIRDEIGIVTWISEKFGTHPNQSPKRHFLEDKDFYQVEDRFGRRYTAVGHEDPIRLTSPTSIPEVGGGTLAIDNEDPYKPLTCIPKERKHWRI